jgi:cytochrome b561
MEARDLSRADAAEITYSTAARRFHWWTVAFVAVQIPVGLYMAYRGNTLNLWDGLTNTLYSSHKLSGIIIFCLVLARLLYRLSHGAPPPEPTIEPWQLAAANFNHWGMYLLLLIIPILGYIGISLFPALDIFGLFSLPGIVAPDQEAAKRVFYFHWLGALILVLMIGIHVSAAMFHYFIRKDGVLRRMLVRAGKLS